MSQKRVREDTLPWWKYGMVWMVVGGPLVVVIAGLTTFYIAWKTQDQIVSDPPPGVSAPHGVLHGPAAAALTPALQARNHAATGGTPSRREAMRP